MEKVQNIFHANFFRQISIFFLSQDAIFCERKNMCFAYPANYNFDSTAFVPRASRLRQQLNSTLRAAHKKRLSQQFPVAKGVLFSIIIL